MSTRITSKNARSLNGYEIVSTIPAESQILVFTSGKYVPTTISSSNLGNANLTADAAERSYTLFGNTSSDKLIFQNLASEDILTLYGNGSIDLRVLDASGIFNLFNQNRPFLRSYPTDHAMRFYDSLGTFTLVANANNQTYQAFGASAGFGTNNIVLRNDSTVNSFFQMSSSGVVNIRCDSTTSNFFMQNTRIGGLYTDSFLSKFGVKGTGSTSATTTALFQNSSSAQLLQIKDGGEINLGSTTSFVTPNIYLDSAAVDQIKIYRGSTAFVYFSPAGQQINVVGATAGTNANVIGANGQFTASGVSSGAYFYNAASAERSSLFVSGDEGILRLRNNSSAIAVQLYSALYNYIDGRIAIGKNTYPTCTLDVEGEGSTSATTTAIFKNSSSAACLTIKDDLSVTFGSVIELGHASDTTISRVSSGKIAVEGVNVVTTSSTDTLTNKTLTSPKLYDAYTGFNIILDVVNNSVDLTANRTLLIDVNDASRQLILRGNLLLSGAFTTSGSFSTNLTATANTTLTLPTTGTLSTLAGNETLTNKTLTVPILTAPVTIKHPTGPTLFSFQNDLNGNVEIGRQDNVASTPYLDFHSGAVSVDYDTRILSSGGNGTSGNGTLMISAATLTTTGAISATASISTSSTIELGHASDTTIARVSAGVVSIEGVNIVTRTSTDTLTNKRVTPRVGTTTSSATPTINTDIVDYYELTAQAVDITSFTTNLSGTPTKGQKLWIAITGTAARAITWGASFEASTIALPTTTVSTNRLDVGFIWNDVTNKWRCVGSV